MAKILYLPKGKYITWAMGSKVPEKQGTRKMYREIVNYCNKYPSGVRVYIYLRFEGDLEGYTCVEAFEEDFEYIK